MHWRCPRHGNDRPRRRMSRTISEAIEKSTALPPQVHPVAVVYPDQKMKVDVGFYDADDYRVIADYASSRPADRDDLYPILPELRRTLPAPGAVLVSRDFARRVLNDRVFIIRFNRRIMADCAECLRETLRAAGRPADLDLGLPNLSFSYNIQPSPAVNARWGRFSETGIMKRGEEPCGVADTVPSASIARTD